jgi:hypothetical protein
MEISRPLGVRSLDLQPITSLYTDYAIPAAIIIIIIIIIIITTTIIIIIIIIIIINPIIALVLSTMGIIPKQIT